MTTILLERLGIDSSPEIVPATQLDPITMRERVENFDWSVTPLGPKATWPASLKSMVAMVVAADQPMLLWWGKDLVQIYNEAFAPSLGADRHPSALGQRALDCWQDVWPIVGSQIANVLSCAQPTIKERALVPIWRNGRLEEIYWNYTYTPVFDDDDQVAGVLTICTEITSRVLIERRQGMLAGFVASVAHCTMPEDVLGLAGEAARTNAVDIRFLRVDEQTAELADEAGSVTFRILEPKSERGLRISFGLSEQRPFDDDYRVFLEQFTKAIDDAISQAESRQRYDVARADRDRLLLDAPVGTAVLVGADLVYDLANTVYCTMTDRDSNIVGKKFTEVFPELVDTATHQVFVDAYRTGIPFQSGEAYIPLKIKGSNEYQDKYYDYNLAPLRNSAGRVFGLMVIAVDITLQVIARKEIERLNRDLIQTSQAKDEFLAMLGHELRNPLAPISAASDLLQRTKPDEALIRKTSEIIARQSRHMTNLINDLLDVSRVTRGLVTLDVSPIGIKDIVQDAIEQVAPMIRSARHQLLMDLFPDKVVVMGDKKRLVQAIANLLTNAAKYTPEGGHIQLNVKTEDGQVVIAVTDNGIGMKPEFAVRAFDLFAQAERTPDRTSGGLGLGLALVKSLVELHRGTVACFSEGLSKGSRFTVSLPLLPSQIQEVGGEPDKQYLKKAKTALRILVVDDNTDAATMMAMLLGASGHDITVEHSPHRALARAKADLPQVCLLDIGLPEMSGNELARCLKDEPATSNCVLIAVTGYGQESDYISSRAAGFDHHLVKPVDISKLINILENIKVR